jgi:hypothetical protein
MAASEHGRRVMRVHTYVTTALILLLAIAVRAREQSPPRSVPAVRSAAASSLPPVLQTCPMHPDVVEEQPGTCPVCQMKLVPVRLQSVWSCPLHPAIARDAKGRCPVCGRPLVQMTMALTWTCKGRADLDVIQPGRCPDGSPMIAKRTLRPHGNHNPQHGGQFFMAPDNQHHLEGTLPAARLFRVYVYDEYARPLPPARIKQVAGRVEVNGRAIPLTASIAGSYLEGRVDAARFPEQMTAKLRLAKDAPEYRFDFSFTGVTREPARAASARQAAPPAARPAATAVDPALIQLPIPASLTGILAQLRTRTTQVKTLIDQGNLAAVFVPAFQARDLALALEDRLQELPPVNRDIAAPAIARLVRTAWLLDSYGDLGNREQLAQAYPEFSAAAAEIARAFAGRTR